MDGYEAAKHIKKIKPHLPIIAQTAYSTEVDRNMALANGCTDFISKPIKKILLISKIKEHLSKTLNY
jgi:CheY-like chemotaxis protein